MFDNVQIFGESLHNAAVGGHIEEQVHWSVHDAVKDIIMHLFQSFINQNSHDPFFGDLACSLEENYNQDFGYVCPEFA